MIECWVHGAVSLSVLSMIGLVEGVIYPQFLNVGGTELKRYATFHQARMGVIIGPLMIAEAVTLGWLWYHPAYWGILLVGTSALLCVVWALTWFVMVPIHRAIACHQRTSDIHRLLRFNRYRTVAWVLKNGGVVLIIVKRIII